MNNYKNATIFSISFYSPFSSFLSLTTFHFHFTFFLSILVSFFSCLLCFLIFFSACQCSFTPLPLLLSALIFINLFLSVLLSAVHGLSSVSLQQQQQQPHLSRREGVVTSTSHRPLERTRSEPPPYSHSPLTLHASHHSHTQHHLQHHKSGPERFKLNAHLSKVSGGRHGH